MQPTDDLRSFLPALQQLSEQHTAQWGRMTPQRMVEHLTDTILCSRGIPHLPLIVEERRAEAGRRFLQSDAPLPHNVDNPLMAPEQPLRHASLQKAIDELSNEIEEFYRFFGEHPTAVYTHPFFGALNFSEWQLFHRKHFRHHCEQFNLLTERGT